MDIPPIGGIRTFPLGSAMRADGTAPRFEIGASSRTSDEKYSSSRQPPEHGPEHQRDQESEDQSGDDPISADEQASGTQINIVA
jgi:hypothetical protein